jgi:hypothetical protein
MCECVTSNTQETDITRIHIYGEKIPGEAGIRGTGLEPGQTRDTGDTRAHTGTRITQTNLTTIQTHQHK